MKVPQLQYFYVDDVLVVQVHLGRPVSDKVVDMPVIVNDSGLQTVEVPQNQFIACFCGHSCYATVLGTQLLQLRYGSDDGFFDAFCVIFRAPPFVPELSASFWSPRALTPVSARGLLHNFMLRVCGHRHPV